MVPDKCTACVGTGTPLFSPVHYFVRVAPQFNLMTIQFPIDCEAFHSWSNYNAGSFSGH